jgi:hypothetical protein
MLEDRDLYQAFYTEHLWGLLPEVYRASDSDDPDKKGPLRELVERLGLQIAVVRRSIDRTAEDASIESSDDWLISYIGDLLATNLVAGLDARAQRLDVAKTIYYRRRKGTVAILEEIAADVTGWNARIVEFFRRLARSRHGFDPEIGIDFDQALIAGLRGALSGTPAGGFADLRHAGVAAKAHTPPTSGRAERRQVGTTSPSWVCFYGACAAFVTRCPRPSKTQSVQDSSRSILPAVRSRCSPPTFGIRRNMATPG